MSSIVVKDADKLAIRELTSSTALMEASEAVALLPAKLTITSDAEAASIGDVRLKAKRGIKTITEGLTALFAPQKAIEKVVREHFKQPVALLESAVVRIDSALLAHDAAKREAADRARREQEAAAAAAAKSAQDEAARIAALHAEAIASGDDQAAQAIEDEADDAPPPGVAQIVVAEPERVVRSEASTTYTVTTQKCEVVDLDAALKAWPECFDFNTKAALASHKNGVALGTMSPSTEKGVIINGVRFWGERGIGGRSR